MAGAAASTFTDAAGNDLGTTLGLSFTTANPAMAATTGWNATQAELEVLADIYFSPSAEYTSLYDGLASAGVVNQLYQNIFGREAEVEGLIYWAGQLDTGAQTVASLALQLSYSAQGTDLQVVANRIEAAGSFTTGLDTTSDRKSVV